MKLQKFRKNRKQKGIAIGCAIALLITIAGINLYRTFALYKEERTFNVLRGVVPDFSGEDISLTFTVNGEARTGEGFPNKESGYSVNTVSCDNNVLAEFDKNSWSLMNIQNPNGATKIKCAIDFKQFYKETLLAGADPVLDEGGTLIPVIVDPNTGAVTKADTTKEWYNYGKKEWANAIIPTSSAKSSVQGYSAGKTITEDQIESYFVWIPKYKYKIQTLDTSTTPKAFDIVFGTTNTTDKNGTECPTPKTSGESGNCQVDDYMTHPAFLAFGGNGLWVGKFETGYKDAISTSGAEQAEANSNKVVIKPNQYSWRSINVSDAFGTAKGYQEDLDSHMMKNTEWGAVAYLTQSIYGRCTSSTSCTEVTINSNSSYKTGYTNSSTSYPTSKNASTTGNNTGIYDMSGGAYEYVMGVMYGGGNTKPSYGYSGFKDATFPTDSKYYDVYKYSSNDYNYSRRILGDATAETDGWYSDTSSFVYEGDPWYRRGGDYEDGTSAGLFGFRYAYGNGSMVNGFRVVITVH